MRIDQIASLSSKCTGCLACVDVCPKGCIERVVGDDGFLYSQINLIQCIDCGKCAAVCPIAPPKKHCESQHLYAAYSTVDGGQSRGSSGGVFEQLAIHCINQGYYVCGASFEHMKCRHQIVDSQDKISSLLKSKYIQSDMSGIYKQINTLLMNGQRVFFCGTPCQVSALKNYVPERLQSKLLTADIVCHGVPSQSMFDRYIGTLEKESGGTVTNFEFRVKDNRYRHHHGFRYYVHKDGTNYEKNGVYTQSSYYNAFKNYLIFRESCYSCSYATLNRNSDITLADFWGIEKYDFDGDMDKGISMVITNSPMGEELFRAIGENIHSKEYPIQYGIDSNYCLTHSTNRPKSRDQIIETIKTAGYETAAKKFFSCSWKYTLYWLIPAVIRNKLRVLRGKLHV